MNQLHKIKRLIAIICTLLLLPLITAFKHEEQLADKKLEAQAQSLFLQLKCVTCEGEALSESSSQFAYDSRKIIRNKLLTGVKPSEIRGYFKSRYGEEILLNHKSSALSSLVLWIMPLLLLLVLVFYRLNKK